MDACVLLDIFNDDKRFSEWSIKTLSSTQRNHDLVINSIIFSEVSLNFDSCAALTQVLQQLDIEIPLPVAFQVSRTFKQCLIFILAPMHIIFGHQSSPEI